MKTTKQYSKENQLENDQPFTKQCKAKYLWAYVHETYNTKQSKRVSSKQDHNHL